VAVVVVALGHQSAVLEVPEAVEVGDLVLHQRAVAVAQHSILAQVDLVRLVALVALTLAVAVDQVQRAAPQVSAEVVLLLFATHHKIKD
jgi:hypothetical protein